MGIAMEEQRIFEVLGIGETKDGDEIRRAYRKKLLSVNPEDNPEGFKRLRKAYESALAMCRRAEDTQEEEDTPVSRYLKEAEAIYSSLSRRLDEEEWKRLANHELLDDLELEEEIRRKLFRYLVDHFRLPASVWQILDRAFGIVEGAGELKEHLPEDFVNFMVWKCSEGADDSDFPFDKLEGEDRADYDTFIANYNQLVRISREEAEDKESWRKEIGQKIAFMDTFGIRHPWYEMEKARYMLLCGQKEEAERMARALWDRGEKDIRMLFSGAYILKECGQGEEAAAVYQDLLEREEMTNEDIYTASVALAEIFAEKREWEEAKEYALHARRLYNTKKAMDLLNECNAEIIALYTGEKAGEMDAEKGVMLAWCYIQAGRAEEGLGFFKNNPVLEEDTAECHRVKTVLYVSGGLDEEGAAEARLWRKSLEEQGLPKEEEEAYRMAQSYEMEGKALQIRLEKLEDKEGEEAADLKAAAMAAFQEAVEHLPEETDFLMAKLNFLRSPFFGEKRDNEQIVEICEKIKKIDNGYYWAYFYAQEAYEKMGKAQEVVDTYYEAKKIYAGMPEIYERAARAFWAYSQFRETKNIIAQAEEAGINSYYLRLRKLEMMRREAEDEDAMKAVDEYVGKLIEEMEEKGDAQEDLLSDAYLQRAFTHDNGYAKVFRQVDEMERWAKRSVELADNNRNRYFLGRFYEEYKGESGTAYEHLKKCEERGLDFEWLYFYIAQCHEDFEEWDKAIEYYKKAMEKNPEESDFVWRVGWLYRKKFDRTGQKEYYEKAIKYLNLQVEKFGETSRELWQLSDLHGNVREYGLALAEIDRALEKDQQCRNWGQRGLLLQMSDRKEEAMESFEKAIEVQLKKGYDYHYSYYRMHDYFCEQREYERGIGWLEEKLNHVLTETQRDKILQYIKDDYMALENWEKALETLERIYGGTTLEDYVCDEWKKEGKRISDLLDLYQCYLPEEDLRRKTEEAEALLERGGREGMQEDHGGMRRAYMQIAFCYDEYLSDSERGLAFFRKALEYDRLIGIGNSDCRWTLTMIMRNLWRMGRTEEAKEYRELYRKSLAESYEECAELGKSLEELYLGECTSRRVSLYNLFQLCYYCGEYEEARKYLQQMESCEWCSSCMMGECTEEWECKGYMALHDGFGEEAARCFEHAVKCCLRRNDQARHELRVLGRKREEV